MCYKGTEVRKDGTPGKRNGTNDLDGKRSGVYQDGTNGSEAEMRKCAELLGSAHGTMLAYLIHQHITPLIGEESDHENLPGM